MTRRRRGQTATEYMLAISVIAISVASAFWLIFADDPNAGPSGGGPAKRSFQNLRDVIEKPYP